MAYRRGGRRGRGKSDGEFIRLTGLWVPDENKKYKGSGSVTREILEELLEAMDKKGLNIAKVFLFLNGYAEGRKDPRWVLSAIPKDEDEDGGRKRYSRKRRDEDEEEEDDVDEDDEDQDDDDEEDEEEEEEKPRRKRSSRSSSKASPKRRKREPGDDDEGEEAPF